jgi:phospholipase/lecithinase/hemolysin
MRFGTLVLAAALTAAPATSFAAAYSSVISFGDSLSDPGNASIATLGAVPGPGYATRSVPLVPFPVGYYTNPQSGSGPSGLWIDQLSSMLGVADPQPFLARLGGTNYSIGSATTSSGVPNMNMEVGLFLTANPSAPSNALYTLWGGGDDIFQGLSPTAAADTIATEILTLHAAGANNFLWLDLPGLGKTPGLSGNPLTAALANAASAAFDAEWASRLSFLQALGIHVTGLDVNALFNSILANPAAYGFTNVTAACNATPGCNPNSFLYWDLEHPTTYADSLVASAAFNALNPTPEPPSVVLLGLGCLFTMTAGFTRRMQRARVSSR